MWQKKWYVAHELTSHQGFIFIQQQLPFYYLLLYVTALSGQRVLIFLSFLSEYAQMSSVRNLYGLPV